MNKSITASIQQGHGVASGRSESSPYPAGSIAMQVPHFKALGLDLSNFFFGTLNLSIAPRVFQFNNPAFTFRQVKWAEKFPVEDFSFSPCRILFEQKSYNGFIYYPHPATKIGHFHSNSLLEVVAEKIHSINYGDNVVLYYNDNELTIA